MAFPDGYVLHDRFWYAANGSGPWFIDADGTALPIAVPCTDITEANLALVAASATNIGKEYWVTDRRGGCRVKSNGTTWVEVPDANIPAQAVAGAVIGVSFVRDRRYVRCQYAVTGEEGATATVAVLLGQPAKIY